MEREFEILFVEDDVGLASNLQDILEEKGYPVAVAHNGQTALALFREKIFDLALIDLKLPDMSGEELIDQLTALSPRTEYIIITGYASLEGAVEAVRKKIIIAYEIKPIDIDRLVSFVDQVAKRKRAEEALRESEKRYRYIVETSLEGICIINEELRTTFVNQRMADMLGYAPEEILGRTLASFMFEEDLEDHKLKVDACRRGVAEIFERRFRRKDGTTIWNIASASPLFDSEGRFTGYCSMFTDITERKKGVEELQNTLERLRKAVAATIHAMVSAVELRDPYTAGHQRRVANLARAIAAEMGLSQDKIDTIRVAGSIHDIGKLSIPAEILSKPKKLSAGEFAMIKEHSGRGYEMLKDVESSWPLAEIVYQHHERMDGSGYPRNLKGEEICLEARILAVADVVEAMASRRPYRPALGIDAALKEIENNRGTHYDIDVVDACLRKFREQGFQLEGD